MCSIIPHVTKGEGPTGCPWKCFTNPVVRDVMNVHQWFDSGQIGVRLGDDPPYFLLEAVEVYHNALLWAKSDRDYRVRQASEQNKDTR